MKTAVRLYFRAIDKARPYLYRKLFLIESLIDQHTIVNNNLRKSLLWKTMHYELQAGPFIIFNLNTLQGSLHAFIKKVAGRVLL